VALVLVVTAAILPVSAQNAPAISQPRLSEYQAALGRYYEKPFDIPRFILDWQGKGRPVEDTVIGFLAGVFAGHPDQIEKVAAGSYQPLTQVPLIRSMFLAGKALEARRTAERWGWGADKVAEMPAITPLHQMKVERPEAFDVLWAASFAAGDARYLRPVYDYYVDVVGQDGVDAADIATIALARHADNREAVRALAPKYPRETFIRVVYASSALWSLESNSRQHKFVATALDGYATEQPDGKAAKALQDYRSRMRDYLAGRR
jgi:hypothetical protein